MIFSDRPDDEPPDSDQDGDISVEDAYAYAFEQVRRAGVRQTPQRWLYGAEGSIRLARTPPELLRPPRPPPLEPSRPLVAAAVPAAGPPQDPPVRTSEAVRDEAWRPTDPARRRPRLLATVGAGVLAAAALAAVLVAQARDEPGSTAGGTSGTIVQESPWRLRISDAEADVGCNVTLTDDSGEPRTWEDFYGNKTFHMRKSGTFRYQVNDVGCELYPLRGDGGVTPLPFTWSAADGDTPVFESRGAVTVHVEDRHGSPTCELSLESDADGRPKNSLDAAEDQDVVRLESNGPGRVYVAATTCSIRVTAG